MSVISCRLLRGHTGAINADGRHRYGALYEVLTNDPTDEWLVVKYQAESSGPDPLPKFRQTYDLGESVDFGAFAGGFNGVQDVNVATRWTVQVQWMELEPGESPAYTGDGGTPLPGIPFDDPLEKPDVFWIEQEVYTRPMYTDADGFPVLNAAGFPYDRPITREFSREVYTWVKRFGTLGEIRDLNESFRLHYNTTAFAGYPPEFALCRPITASPIMHQNGADFYEATIRVAAQQHSFLDVVPELGWKHFQFENPFDPQSDVFVVEARDRQANPDGSPGHLVPSSEPVRLINDPTRPELRGFRESQYNFGVDNAPTTWTTKWETYPGADLNGLGVSIPT